MQKENLDTISLGKRSGKMYEKWEACEKGFQTKSLLLFNKNHVLLNTKTLEQKIIEE